MSSSAGVRFARLEITSRNFVALLLSVLALSALMMEVNAFKGRRRRTIRSFPANPSTLHPQRIRTCDSEIEEYRRFLTVNVSVPEASLCKWNYTFFSCDLEYEPAIRPSIMCMALDKSYRCVEVYTVIPFVKRDNCGVYNSHVEWKNVTVGCVAMSNLSEKQISDNTGFARPLPKS